MYVRIIPDILKLENSYWYKVSPSTKDSSSIVLGSIVRVYVNSRRVKGWVAEISFDFDEIVGKYPSIQENGIKEVIECVSDGPPAHIVKFCESLSKHYLVSPVYFLRSSSCKNIVSNLRQVDFANNSHARQKLFLVDPRADRRKLILEELAKAGSTIIVSPDSQNKLKTWLRGLGKNVVDYYSQDTISAETYRKAQIPNSVIIGGRKSIFAPSTDLQKIILLDDSYEQLSEERTPKYSAVDVALLASEYFSIELSVISSIPSARAALFETQDLRDSSKHWPPVFIDDRSKADPVLGIFSSEIINAIRQSLELGHNSAIVLNNKSAAKLMICSSCNEIATCSRCSHNVVLKENDEPLLQCINCNETRPTICLQCQGTRFKKLRKGIPSILEECQKIFPRQNVEEFKKENVFSSQPTLFVSTEAILYNEQFSTSLASIIFIDFDSFLFRNAQDAFVQSLVVANRAMRKIVHTEVKNPIIISTFAGSNQIILDLKSRDLYANSLRDLEIRQQLKLPPFYAMCKVIAETQSILNLCNNIPSEVVVGVTKNGEKSTLVLRAKSHSELSISVERAIRNFISKNRCSISVDSTD